MTKTNPLGEYTLHAATSTSNAVCATCSAQCNRATEYQETACRTTGSSDRVCKACTVCGTGTNGVQDYAAVEYQAKSCSRGANAVCKASVPCIDRVVEADAAAVMYEVKAMTKTKDRICRVVTECEFEMVAPTPTSNRVCEDCTQPGKCCLLFLKK